jgi:hypothetical protein
VVFRCDCVLWVAWDVAREVRKGVEWREVEVVWDGIEWRGGEDWSLKPGR